MASNGVAVTGYWHLTAGNRSRVQTLTTDDEQQYLTPVQTFLFWFAYAIHLFGYAVVILAVVLAVVALVDWMVRTRRINPFNPVARLFRRAVDPLIAPMERRVVRAGGMPHAAPWWMLVAVVVGGIIVLSLLRFIFAQLAGAYGMASMGARGIAILLLHYTFALLKLAIIVRVVLSWIRI